MNVGPRGDFSHWRTDLMRFFLFLKAFKMQIQWGKKNKISLKEIMETWSFVQDTMPADDLISIREHHGQVSVFETWRRSLDLPNGAWGLWIWKMTPFLCACTVVITLETQKCWKKAPRFIEFNFFTNHNRNRTRPPHTHTWVCTSRLRCFRIASMLL